MPQPAYPIRAILDEWIKHENDALVARGETRNGHLKMIKLLTQWQQDTSPLTIKNKSNRMKRKKYIEVTLGKLRTAYAKLGNTDFYRDVSMRIMSTHHHAPEQMDLVSVMLKAERNLIGWIAEHKQSIVKQRRVSICEVVTLDKQLKLHSQLSETMAAILQLYKEDRFLFSIADERIITPTQDDSHHILYSKLYEALRTVDDWKCSEKLQTFMTHYIKAISNLCRTVLGRFPRDVESIMVEIGKVQPLLPVQQPGQVCFDSKENTMANMNKMSKVLAEWRCKENEYIDVLKKAHDKATWIAQRKYWQSSFIDWLAAHRSVHDGMVLNMSLGAAALKPYIKTMLTQLESELDPQINNNDNVRKVFKGHYGELWGEVRDYFRNVQMFLKRLADNEPVGTADTNSYKSLLEMFQSVMGRINAKMPKTK